jgi:TPR repeat protein
VIAIDRFVRRFNSESLLNLWNPAWLGGRGNLAHMAVWIGVFSLMSLLGRTDAQHPGDSVPFWEKSCAADLPNACTRLISVESTYCGDSAAWACNELGAHYREGRIVKSDPDLAFAYFARACELKLQAGCANLLDEQLALRANPLELDLRLMLRQGGKNLMDASVPELYDRACRHDWAFACARSGGD